MLQIYAAIYWNIIVFKPTVAAQPSATTSQQHPGTKHSNQQVPCPKHHCNRVIIDVVKHLKFFHKMSHYDAKRLYMEVNEKYRHPKGKHCRPLKKCPLCLSRVQRLDQHLIRTHKYPIDKAKDVIRGMREALKSGNVHNYSQQPHSLAEATGKFKVWLESFSGGRRKESVSAMHCSAVTKVLEDVGVAFDMISLRSLVMVGGYVDRKTKDGFQPGSLKAYLSSLKMFYSFLKIDRRAGNQYGVSYEFADIAILEVSNWITSLREKLTGRQHVYAEEETHTVQLVSKALENYENTEHFRKATAVLKSSTPVMGWSASEFTVARDYLIMRILTRNGQRAGAIRNALTTECNTMSKQEDGQYILKVNTTVYLQ